MVIKMFIVILVNNLFIQLDQLKSDLIIYFKQIYRQFYTSLELLFGKDILFVDWKISKWPNNERINLTAWSKTVQLQVNDQTLRWAQDSAVMGSQLRDESSQRVRVERGAPSWAGAGCCLSYSCVQVLAEIDCTKIKFTWILSEVYNIINSNKTNNNKLMSMIIKIKLEFYT